MSTPQLVPMIAQDGSIGDVPAGNVDAALSRGLKRGVNVISKDGQKGTIPLERLGEALQSGMMPEHAMQMRRPMNANPSIGEQIDSGLQTVGNAVPGAIQGMLHAVANPVQAGSQMAIAGMQSAEGQPTTGSKVAAGVAPFVGVDPEAVKKAAITAGTTGNYGPLVASGVLPLASAHIGTSKVGPQLDAGAIVKDVAAGEIDPRALPSKANAGENFAAASQAAGVKPIDLSGPGQSALNVMRLAKAGGSMPKVVNDFLRRVTDPKQGPLTFDEAREFYSNASRISADEAGRLTPVMNRALIKFTQDLGQSIGQTAEDAGVGPQYQGAMKEYGQAARNQKRIEMTKEVLKTAAKATIPAAAAAYTAKSIWDAKR